MLVTLKKKQHHSRISFGTNNFNLVEKKTNCPQDVKLCSIAEKSKQLFPRCSKRRTDTKVMSLLHGHDVCFRSFDSRVTGNCDPQCPNCPASDDNLHRLFVCPLFNSAFRDTLQLHSTNKHPSWSILSDQSKESSKAFRCLSQLAITDETQVPLVTFLRLFLPSSTLLFHSLSHHLRYRHRQPRL